MTGIDHGGNLDAAIARFGGARSDWLDLSTGISPCPYPVPDISRAAWTRLPEAGAEARLLDAARRHYTVHPANGVAAAPGAQALIQLLPSLARGPKIGVLWPSYGEYDHVFLNSGFDQVEALDRLDDQPGGDVVIVCNPNNPDGRRFPPEALLDLAAQCGLLVVDEAFGDTDPNLSLCPHPLPDNVLLLRSFGKFFGLAGLRLGFAVGSAELLDAVRGMLGPWAVTGPALEIGAQALSDNDWIAASRARLRDAMDGLQAPLERRIGPTVGRTDLFITLASTRAEAIFDHLARHHILVRAFDHHSDWLRVGLPPDEAARTRLLDVLSNA